MRAAAIPPPLFSFDSDNSARLPAWSLRSGYFRAATRLETVLQLVEREIRPLASQVEGLTAEVRTLSQTANQELKRISGVIRRVELISFKIARVVGVANNLASFRGVTSVSSGLKRALGVFVSRLKA